MQRFGGNRKPVYDFISAVKLKIERKLLLTPLVVAFVLSSTVSEILPVYYIISTPDICTPPVFIICIICTPPVLIIYIICNPFI